MTTVTQMTNEQLSSLYAQARKRLASLGIDPELAEDQTGQTSAEEHLTWLTTATDAAITEWAQYFN